MEMWGRDLEKPRKKRFTSTWHHGRSMAWTGASVQTNDSASPLEASLKTTKTKYVLWLCVCVCVCVCVWICTHLQLQIIQLDEDRGEFVLRATFDHPYPTTKIMWIPDQTAQLPDLVATSGDYLWLWRVNESQVRQECMLNNVSPAVISSVHVPCLIPRLLPAFLCCMLQHLKAESGPRMR